MKYAISDIHGHYEMFRQMLEKIRFTKEDKLYILGDMIDRGDEPLKLVQYVMKQPNIYPLLGNHEDMMLNVLHDQDDEVHLERWYRNGGEITHNQFKELEEDVQKDVRTYLENLPLYIDLEKYLLIHAGVYLEENESNPTWENIKSRQNKRDLVWIRELFYKKPALKDRVIVFGHTQTYHMGEAGEIWFDKDKIDIDCGVYSKSKNGTLGCLNLDTLETYYIYND